MKIFDNWALKRAEKIKHREALEQREREETSKKHSDHRSKIEYEIRRHISALMEEYEKMECHIEVGDRAIMNYFSIKRPGRNSWDGGVASLLDRIPKEERTQPVIVNITKLYVDTSFSNELLDRFFLEHSSEWLFESCKVENAWKSYQAWRRHHLSRAREKALNDVQMVGLYKTAHFDYEGSFKPKWGLNVNCFHKDGTPEFENTFNLWSREIEINRKKEEVRKELQKLEEELQKLEEEIRSPHCL